MSSLLSWSDEYSVGVKEINEQHKQLVALINQLHDAMKSGKGSSEVSSVLSELTKYTVNHFGFEEKLLEKNNYPTLKAHQKIHADLIERLKELQNKASNPASLVTIEVMNFLKTWLIDHICKVDKGYSSHLNGRGVF